MKNWCLLRNSEDVRMVVAHRLKDYNQKELCKALGLDYMNFRHWLDGSKPKAITQHAVWRVCQKIGIRISVKVELV